MEWLPAYKIKIGQIFEYQIPEGFTHKTEAQIEKEKWLRSHTQYLNDLSDKARKRLLDYLKTLYLLSKENNILARKVLESRAVDGQIIKQLGEKYKKPVTYKLTFITLTLSYDQLHSDREIKRKMLKDFLDRMQKKFNTYLYIWKAEKQQNGRIHFHIITNRYVPHQWIRSTWNRIQNKQPFRYIDRYAEKQKQFYRSGFRYNPDDPRPRDQQRKSYLQAKAEGFRNPNSTDIHAVYKIKKLDAYFAKYVTKLLDENIGEEVKDVIKKIRMLDITISDPDVSEFDKNKLRAERDSWLEWLYSNYKDKLIEGKIWDASKTLKKLAPYSQLGYIDDLMDKLELDFTKMTNKQKDLGEQVINMWFWELDEQPKLKDFILNHYVQQLIKQRSDLFKVL